MAFSPAIKNLYSITKSEWKSLGIGTFFLVSSSALNLSIPTIVGWLIDDITSGEGKVAIDYYAGLLIIIFVSIGISTFFRSYLFTIAGERIVMTLQKNLFTSLVNQDISFFDVHRTGELTNRLAADTTVLQKAVTINVSMGLRFILSVVGAVSILMWTSWRLTVLMLLTVPLVAGAAGIYGRMLRSLSRKVQDALAESTAVAEESLSGIRTVRAFAQEKEASRGYAKAINDAFALAKKRAFMGASFQGFVSIAGLSAIGVVLWYGSTMLTQGRIAFGELTAFMLYTFTVAFSVGALSSLYEDFAKAIGATERVFSLLNQSPSILDGDVQPDDCKGDIELKNVSFFYPTRPDNIILQSCDLHIRPSQVLALVGPSGSGKSTIAALISRMYDPNVGGLYLDGVPIQKLKLEWLRFQVGVVSQEPILFASSIKDNIRYARPTASDEEVISAAKSANAHEFVLDFSEGYDTLVGERGVRLSGGQKQRIAIARALLKNPKILILDEATSALDAESEHLVQEALEHLMMGRTTLVIAHRLSTIQDANSVAVLDGGQIKELGTHQELMSKNGIYFRLVQRQFSGIQSAVVP